MKPYRLYETREIHTGHKFHTRCGYAILHLLGIWTPRALAFYTNSAILVTATYISDSLYQVAKSTIPF